MEVTDRESIKGMADLINIVQERCMLLYFINFFRNLYVFRNISLKYVFMFLIPLPCNEVISVTRVFKMTNFKHCFLQIKKFKK